LGVGAVFSALLTLPLIPSLGSADWLRRPLWDDAYYYLVIARNVARGLGVTVNGHPVSGFQPLYLLPCVLAGALTGWSQTGAPALLTAFNWALYNLIGAWLLLRLWREIAPGGATR